MFGPTFFLDRYLGANCGDDRYSSCLGTHPVQSVTISEELPDVSKDNCQSKTRRLLPRHFRDRDKK